MAAIGETDDFLRPYVRLLLRGEDGREQTIKARLDTGFDKSFAVPETIVAALGLRAVRGVGMYLADGSYGYFMEYRARVMWEGLARPIRVLAKSGEPLVGVALFLGYRVSIEFVDGGEVIAEPL